MAEPTLSLTTDVLRDEIAIARFGGDHPSDAGAAYDALDAGEKERVDRLLSRALRRFNNPTLPGGKRYEWSFLSPWSSLVVNAAYSTGTVEYDHTGGASERLVTLTDGTWPSWFTGTAITRTRIRIDGIDYAVATKEDATTLTLDESNNPGEDVDSGTSYSLHQDNYQLDSDVGLIFSPITFKQADNATWTCRKTTPHHIEILRMGRHNVEQETPRLFATRKIARNETTGTAQDIIFWPSISSEATVLFQYRVRPDSLSTDNGYPYGASDHSETILQACLAAVEEDFGERGVHSAAYTELLLASVELDARSHRPMSYGKYTMPTRRYGGLAAYPSERAPHVWSGVTHETSP